jgi:hypothetical protein
MAATRDLTVRINGDTSGLEKALDKAGKSSGGFGEALDKAKGGSFALLGGLTAAAAGATFFGVKAMSAFNDAQASQAQLEHAVIGVTHATKEQLDQTAALSDALEKKGVLDGDNIKVGLAQLSTFGLSNKAVQALGGSLADLAVNQFGVSASGDQLSQSANMIAKALNGQFGVLEKSGIRFTEAQKQTIQFGTETEKVAAINAGFAQNLKYTNEVARQTGEGGLAHMKVQLGNVQEAIGGLVNKAIGPVINAMSDWVDSMGGPDGILKSIGDKIKELEPYFPIIAGAIIGGLVPAFVALGVSIWTALAPLLPFIAAGAALGLGVKLLIDHFGGLGNVMKQLQPVFQALHQFWSQMLLPALTEVWKAFSERLLPSLQRLWAILEPVLMPVLKALGIIIGVVIIAQIMLFVKALEIGISWLSNIVNWIGNAINWVKGLADWFGKIPSMISSAFSSIYDNMTKPFSKAFDFIKDIPGKIVGAVGNIGQLLHDKLGDWDIPGPLGKVKDVIPGFASGVTNFSGGLAIVGERGPELVNLPRGSDVIPNTDLPTSFSGRSLASSGGQDTAGGPSVTINFDPQIQVGMFAGMPTEYREMAERLWTEFTRIAQTNGVKLPTLGARTQ